MIMVIGLHTLGRDDIARAGGKGANLGELIKAGFDVPDGFVWSTRAGWPHTRPSWRASTGSRRSWEPDEEPGFSAMASW